MSEEFLTLVKKLKLPLLSEADVAALQELQEQWRHWAAREQEIMPLRIVEHQKAAFDAFLADPSAENEQRLAVLADPILIGTRYGMLRKAFAEVRGRISDRAGEIVRPVLDRIHKALTAEHERQLQTAPAVMGSRQNNPLVKAARRAIEDADRIDQHISAAKGRHRDYSPLQLAEGLVGGA